MRGTLNVSSLETSDAVKLSSCSARLFGGGGEGDGLVVVPAGDQAVVQAAEQACEQVALGGGVPVAGVFAAVVVTLAVGHRWLISSRIYVYVRNVTCVGLIPQATGIAIVTYDFALHGALNLDRLIV